jgi:hypothetical protein
MTEHKFKIGQLVHYYPRKIGRASVDLVSGLYQIIKRLPSANGEPQYEIRSTLEARPGRKRRVDARLEVCRATRLMAADRAGGHEKSHAIAGSPSPRIVKGAAASAASGSKWFVHCLLAHAHIAGRSETPSGISPVVTMRQSAMRSLRAKATIIVLRNRRPSAVRALYHCANALSFWNMRKRQAN